MLVDGMEGEARTEFLDELYDDGTAEKTAMEQLREHMQEQGKWKEGDGA